MRAACRSYDQVGRYGGEEFLVIASDCDLEAAAILAERIRHNIAERPIDMGNGEQHYITISLGVAVATSNVRVDTLLALADNALYAAKHNGRNRCEFADNPVLQEEYGEAEKRGASYLSPRAGQPAH